MLIFCLDQKLQDPVENLSGTCKEREETGNRREIQQSLRAAALNMKENMKLNCTNCNLSWIADSKSQHILFKLRRVH